MSSAMQSDPAVLLATAWVVMSAQEMVPALVRHLAQLLAKNVIAIDAN